MKKKKKLSLYGLVSHRKDIKKFQLTSKLQKNSNSAVGWNFLTNG